MLVQKTLKIITEMTTYKFSFFTFFILPFLIYHHYLHCTFRTLSYFYEFYIIFVIVYVFSVIIDHCTGHNVSLTFLCHYFCYLCDRFHIIIFHYFYVLILIKIFVLFLLSFPPFCFSWKCDTRFFAAGWRDAVFEPGHNYTNIVLRMKTPLGKRNQLTSNFGPDTGIHKHMFFYI